MHRLQLQLPLQLRLHERRRPPLLLLLHHPRPRQRLLRHCHPMLLSLFLLHLLQRQQRLLQAIPRCRPLLLPCLPQPPPPLLLLLQPRHLSQ